MKKTLIKLLRSNDQLYSIVRKSYFFIKKRIYIPVLSYLVIKTATNEVCSSILFNYSDMNTSKLTRTGYDEKMKNELIRINKLKDELPSISAIYRVKNGSEYIEAAILSVAPIVKEVIVVDNNSTDNTKEIINRLIDELNGITEVKYYFYDKDLEIAGDGYLDRVKNNPEGSLANFYEFSFSKGTSDYLMKCDAHYIFTLKGIKELQKMIKKNPDVIGYYGLEITGKFLTDEPFLFKRNLTFEYIDCQCWEKLVFNCETDVKTIDIPLYLNVKRLSFIKYIYCSKSPAKSKYNIE